MCVQLYLVRLKELSIRITVKLCTMMMVLMQESMKSSLTLNHGLTGISKQLVNGLVGGSDPFAPAATSHGGSDATSGASDASGHAGDASPAADATSGASSY